MTVGDPSLTSTSAGSDQVPGVTLVAQIGKGRFATVHSGREDRLGRGVVVKIMDALDPTGVEEFQRTYARVRRLSTHPGLLTLLGTGVTGQGRPYLSMEPMPGLALIDRFGPGRSLTVLDAVQLGKRVAAGLEVLHRQGILHLDVRPANIMLDRWQRPQLADPGLADIWRDSAGFDRSDDPPGVVAFMAPETLQGDMAPDGRADVYSLAATLYAVLAGHQPFLEPGMDPRSMAQRVIRAQPEDLRTRGLPDALWELLHSSLQKDRTLRPETAGDFGRYLASFGRLTTSAAPGMTPRLSGPPGDLPQMKGHGGDSGPPVGRSDPQRSPGGGNGDQVGGPAAIQEQDQTPGDTPVLESPVQSPVQGPAIGVTGGVPPVTAGSTRTYDVEDLGGSGGDPPVARGLASSSQGRPEDWLNPQVSKPRDKRRLMAILGSVVLVMAVVVAVVVARDGGQADPGPTEDVASTAPVFSATGIPTDPSPSGSASFAPASSAPASSAPAAPTIGPLSLDLPIPSDIASAGGVTVVVCESADAVYVLQDGGIRLLVGTLEGFDSPGTVDLPDPSAVAIGPDGTIYLAGRDSGRILSLRLGDLDTDGQVSTLATMEEGVAPSSLVVADNGALFVGSDASDTVHRVNPDGTVNAIQTDQSVSPLAIATFQDGLLLNDTIDAGVRFLNIGAATVRDVPGLGGLTVTDLLVDQQRLYMLDPVARNLVVADLQPDVTGVPSAVGAVTTLALDLQGDPEGLAVLGQGMVAVGERGSGRILSVDLATGDIQVMAGRS